MSLVIVGIVVTLTLHFGWEMLQAPAFVDFAGSTWEGTVRCFVASLGDVLLASSAYVVTPLAFRRLRWPIGPDWILPAATWIAFGVLAAITFELWRSLKVAGRTGRRCRWSLASASCLSFNGSSYRL